MREGINICSEKTCIDNIFCYEVSSTSVLQFVGRYRGDVKNLFLINSGTNLGTKCDLEKAEYEEFRSLVRGESNGIKYLRRLEYILQDGVSTSIRQDNIANCKYDLFKKYIISRWKDKPIATKEQQQEIVNYANDLGIRTDSKKKPTFKYLIKLVKSLEFNVL